LDLERTSSKCHDDNGSRHRNAGDKGLAFGIVGARREVVMVGRRVSRSVVVASLLVLGGGGPLLQPIAAHAAPSTPHAAPLGLLQIHGHDGDGDGCSLLVMQCGVVSVPACEPVVKVVKVVQLVPVTKVVKVIVPVVQKVFVPVPVPATPVVQKVIVIQKVFVPVPVAAVPTPTPTPVVITSPGNPMF
jgi:hypothetical protein